MEAQKASSVKGYRNRFFQNVLDRSERGDFFFRPILMRFAAREIGASYRDFYLDHRVLVEANLACLDAYGLDAVGLISDPMREAEAFGARCEYPPDSAPHCPDPPVKSLADVERLQNPDLQKAHRTRDRILGAQLLRERLEPEFPVIGWVKGPLAEACDLAGVQAFLLKLGTEPEFCRALLARMVPTAIAFAETQIEAGCQIIGVGDAICSQISPAMYQEFLMEHHRELFRAIQSRGALVKLHICGDITHLLPFLADLKPDILDLDWMVDLDRAYQILGPEIIRSGNLDPVAVVEQGSPNEIYQAARNLCGGERGRPYIASAGCEITPLTPRENLLVLARAVHGNSPQAASI